MMLKLQNLQKKFCYMLLYISLITNSVTSLEDLYSSVKTSEITNENSNNDNLPQVKTESGKLVGTSFTTFKGRKVFAFLGVPYAEPPINELRFKEPQRVTPWDDKREANKVKNKCSQFNHYTMALNGKEDCLYLNIYTPQLYMDNNTKLLDVLVYIHGGAFMYGSGHPYTPKHLLDKMDLVFVSINYRLGPLGFITMDDDIIPGNNGLKDQVFALKWVQNNIKQFSGDRNKVTIAGMSAGGASVNFHYLSKQSQNLFSKGISLSGVATNAWALMDGGKTKTILLAESLNCQTTNSVTLLNCLQEKSDYEILSKIKNLFMPWLYNPFTPFGPTIERAGSEPFLSENPYKLLLERKTKDAPWLVSITSEEGLYPGAEFVNNDTLLNELNNNWVDKAPHLLDFNYTVPVHKHKIISKLIREYYFSNKTISPNTTKELTDLLSDRLFTADIGKTAKLQAISTKANTFMYKFSFRGTKSFSDFLTKSKKNFGVSHGDDLPYILGCFFNVQNDEIKMVEKMVNIWTTFIKTGTPNASSDVTWYPISKAGDTNQIDYLDIRSYQEINMVQEKNFGNKTFWDSLPLQENNFLN